MHGFLLERGERGLFHETVTQRRVVLPLVELFVRLLDHVLARLIPGEHVALPYLPRKVDQCNQHAEGGQQIRDRADVG